MLEGTSRLEKGTFPLSLRLLAGCWLFWSSGPWVGRRAGSCLCMSAHRPHACETQVSPESPGVLRWGRNEAGAGGTGYLLHHSEAVCPWVTCFPSLCSASSPVTWGQEAPPPHRTAVRSQWPSACRRLRAASATRQTVCKMGEKLTQTFRSASGWERRVRREWVGGYDGLGSKFTLLPGDHILQDSTGRKRP